MADPRTASWLKIIFCRSAQLAVQISVFWQQGNPCCQSAKFSRRDSPIQSECVDGGFKSISFCSISGLNEIKWLMHGQCKVSWLHTLQIVTHCHSRNRPRFKPYMDRLILPKSIHCSTKVQPAWRLQPLYPVPLPRRTIVPQEGFPHKPMVAGKEIVLSMEPHPNVSSFV